MASPNYNGTSTNFVSDYAAWTGSQRTIWDVPEASPLWVPGQKSFIVGKTAPTVNGSINWEFKLIREPACPVCEFEEEQVAKAKKHRQVVIEDI